MTKFQALFVLWLRHDTLQSCSWRALAAHYYNRYNDDGIVKSINERIVFKSLTFGGNQLDGMILEEKAWRVLRDPPLFMETPDLFENDLTLINANIKRHIL